MGQLAVFGPGNALTVRGGPVQESRAPNLDVLVLGGRPIREPVAWTGPFVMNTREEVMQAFEDYQAGRLGAIPAVHDAPTTLQESGRRSADRGDHPATASLAAVTLTRAVQPAPVVAVHQDSTASRAAATPPGRP